MSAAQKSSWLCRSCRNSTVAALRPPSSGPARRGFHASAARCRQDRPPRMAIVGSGPAGFYTAYRVMSKVQGTKVDMFEALPVPFGLVRFGVAPDHPEVKNCQDKFDEVASSPDFTFVGNAAVGNPDGHFEGCCDVPLPALMRHYDAVVFAYGASKDRVLGVPGEHLGGVFSAREFVGWYNGLPEFAGGRRPAPDLTRGDEAVIVGQGNVALDVARILLEDVDVLRKTDITAEAVEALSRSRIRRVHVVGRRGPMQAAFTIKEVRELMKLRGVAFHPIDMDLLPTEISKLPRARRRLTEVMVKGSATNVADNHHHHHQHPGGGRSWSLDFCLSPTAFVAGDDGGHVAKTVFERTRLTDPFDPSSGVAALPDAPSLELPSSVAFRSIGYKSVALPGFAEAGISFDERRGVIRNDGVGRVLNGGGGGCGGDGNDDPTRRQQKQEHLPGAYCAGWVKRGPTGVIASTMEDAFSTGDAVARDWEAGVPFLSSSPSGTSVGTGPPAGWEGLRTELEGASRCRTIKWEDWRRIDQAERERGLRMGKEREKFTRTEDMLSVVY